MTLGAFLVLIIALGESDKVPPNYFADVSFILVGGVSQHAPSWGL